MLAIMSPFLLWYLVSWLACLVVTPFAWLARSTLGRPSPVIAHWDENPWAEWSSGADAAGQPTTWWCTSRASWRSSEHRAH
ncbi:hypothetical protein AB0J80_08780 [Actinoplanes sp. NPDC049548]|uniref:hypothetical protein n=1 Tax=Actinoplanes sp. NPDC049548 TaxID=3155152 RepID=UPI0034480DC4